MPFVYYLQIHDLATLMPGYPSRRVARYGFVDNKQIWHFLQSFVSQQLLFFFSKHLDTMSIRRIVSPVKQIFVPRISTFLAQLEHCGCPFFDRVVGSSVDVRQQLSAAADCRTFPASKSSQKWPLEDF